MNDMNRPNLYWPVYKNLENEVLALANVIHICDADTEVIHICDSNCDDSAKGNEIKIPVKQPQMKVYSAHISDLLFRVCAEIESLIKDLYRDDKKTEPASPGAALGELNKQWLLSKKIVNTVAPTFYLQKTENKTFAPFSYAKHDENDYYSTYNALKHDRVKNIKKATVHILIRAMAALYLLNIYYKNMVFRVKNDTEIWQFDKSFGSSLFSVLIDETYKVNSQINDHQGQQDISRCLYVAVYDDRQVKDIVEKTSNYNKQALRLVQLDFPSAFDESKMDQLAKNLNVFDLGRIVGEFILEREIHNLPNRDENAIIKFLRNTELYKEYAKHNPDSIANENSEMALIKRHAAMGYYYKKLMPLFSAAGSLLFSTSSKLILNKLSL